MEISLIPVSQINVDQLEVLVFRDAESVGQACAVQAAVVLQTAIKQRSVANIVLAAGNSQLSFLGSLLQQNEVDWSKVNVFHMDEYLGIDDRHPASFRRFVWQNFLQYVEVAAFYPVAGNAVDIQQACNDYTQLLKEHPADLVVLGLGENGHLAFNDPPYADFADTEWVKVVTLADVSRQQQVSGGQFDSMDSVPLQAITLTIPALLNARQVYCMAPESRKANAVKACLSEPVSELNPGSALRTIAHARLYLDVLSAANL